jgi:hypothetical protein
MKNGGGGPLKKLLVLAALLLVACGGSSPTESKPNPTPTSQTFLFSGAIEAAINLQPIPRSSLTISPGGIYVDAPLGMFQTSLSGGTYTMTATSPGYQQTVRTITISADATNVVFVMYP